jgi:hypothetical protein
VQGGEKRKLASLRGFGGGQLRAPKVENVLPSVSLAVDDDEGGAGHCLRGLLHVLGGRGAGLRLQSVQIIGGLLRVAGGGEDRPLVVFQDGRPSDG